MSRPTAFTRLTGIDHPVVLGPFGGLSSVDLTAMVSAGGGLGSYGLYGYDGDRIRTTGAELRAATTRPFGLNIWLPTGDEAAPNAQHLIFAQALQPFYEAVGVELPARPAQYLPSLDEQLEAIVREEAIQLAGAAGNATRRAAMPQAQGAACR